MDDNAVLFGNVVDATAKDVVLGDHFFDVESIVEALPAVGRRTALEEYVFGDLIWLGLSASANSLMRIGM